MLWVHLKRIRRKVGEPRGRTGQPTDPHRKKRVQHRFWRFQLGKRSQDKQILLPESGGMNTVCSEVRPVISSRTIRQISELVTWAYSHLWLTGFPVLKNCYSLPKSISKTLSRVRPRGRLHSAIPVSQIHPRSRTTGGRLRSDSKAEMAVLTTAEF